MFVLVCTVNNVCLNWLACKIWCCLLATHSYDCQRSTFGVMSECVHDSSLLGVCWSGLCWVCAVLASFGKFSKIQGSTQSYYVTPGVTQKNLYMCLLLDVDVCWWTGRSLALVTVSLRSCQNLTLDTCVQVLISSMCRLCVVIVYLVVRPLCPLYVCIAFPSGGQISINHSIWP